MSNKKEHSTGKIKVVMEMLKVIFCFLLRDYEKDEGFQSLRTGDSNFSSSMGRTMLRNETESNKS